jgi:hypothetical protein
MSDGHSRHLGCQPAGQLPFVCVRAFDFAGLSLPGPGAVLRRSAHSFTVRFQLVASRKGAALASDIVSALVKAHEVRVTLSGPDIHPAAASCTSPGSTGTFRCQVRIPLNVRTGKSHPYLLTVQEDPGGRFVSPATTLRKIANPATIYFR